MRKGVKKNKNYKMLFNEISHTAMGKTQTGEVVKDTLLDFYLLAYSNSTTAFTHYQHGTGFSSECSKLFDVPYQLIYTPL